MTCMLDVTSLLMVMMDMQEQNSKEERREKVKRASICLHDQE